VPACTVFAFFHLPQAGPGGGCLYDSAWNRENLEHLVLEVRMPLGYRKNKSSGGPDVEKKGIGIHVCN